MSLDNGEGSGVFAGERPPRPRPRPQAFPSRRPAVKEPPEFGKLRLDRIGIIYTSVFAVWTALFVVGLVILLRNRRLSFIRLKNVPLVVAALILLHIQLSFDLLAYPLNGVLPCALEFWIMNTCLP